MKKIISILLIYVIFILLLKPFSASAAPTISAKAAVVLNGITREVIYAHNPDMKLSMASTTKIMTALLLAEAGDLHLQETVSSEALVEGSSIGLKKGDKISREALLAGMLLESGNDAATQTAISLAGSVEAFAVIMNQRAKLIGMENTNFVTPSGLDAKEHYSTAYDMALLTSEALCNETFRNFSSTYQMKVSFGTPSVEHTFTNHNKLLKSYDGCIGVKTGYTSKSGRCLVTAARRNGALIIVVTLNDPNDWQDHQALLDYGFEQVELCDITYSGQDMSVAVVGSSEARVEFVVPKRLAGLDKESIKHLSIELSIPSFVYAPTKAGQKLGTVSYYYKGLLLACDNLYIAANLNYYDAHETKDIKFRRSFRLLLSFYK